MPLLSRLCPILLYDALKKDRGTDDLGEPTDNLDSQQNANNLKARISISFNCLISKRSFYIDDKSSSRFSSRWFNYARLSLNAFFTANPNDSYVLHLIVRSLMEKNPDMQAQHKIRLKIYLKRIPWWFSGQRTSVWLTVGLGDRSSLTEHVQIFPFAIKFDQARQIADSWLPVAPVPRSKGSSTRAHRYDVLRFFFFLPEKKSAESQNHALHGFINYC